MCILAKLGAPLTKSTFKKNQPSWKATGRTAFRSEIEKLHFTKL